MSGSRIELWLDTMYKIHSMTRADKDSLKTINELISHISEGRPIMAIQDDEQLATVAQAVKSITGEDTEPMH